jgi:hypothetical protein
MKRNDDYGGFGYQPLKDSPGMAAVKKAIKNIVVENYIKGLNTKATTQKKG